MENLWLDNMAKRDLLDMSTHFGLKGREHIEGWKNREKDDKKGVSQDKNMNIWIFHNTKVKFLLNNDNNICLTYINSTEFLKSANDISGVSGPSKCVSTQNSP